MAQFQTTKPEEYTQHLKVHRPWDWFDTIDEGKCFNVKRIQVKPKANFSLQNHQHRAEHWVVARGTAEITNGDKTIPLIKNQSTYIPLGKMYRLTNPVTILLEIMEVQSATIWARMTFLDMKTTTDYPNEESNHHWYYWPRRRLSG